MYEGNFCKANFCKQKPTGNPNITEAQRKTQGFAETQIQTLYTQGYIHPATSGL